MEIYRRLEKQGRQRVTFVYWRCEACNRKFRSRLDSIKDFVNKGLDVCRTCSRRGGPRLLAQVKKAYSYVIGAKSKSVRGGVAATDTVVVRCPGCKNKYDVLFGSLLKIGNAWKCVSCSHREQFGISLLYPGELPKGVLKIKKSSLGKVGQVVFHTSVFVKCVECNKGRYVLWGNYIGGKVKICRACVTRLRWRDSEYREWYSEMLTEKWKDKNYRKNVMRGRAARPHKAGYTSKLHLEIKGLFKRHRINGFESEVLIGNCTVDEVDLGRKIALEVFGDYWHCNPNVFLPGSVRRLGNISTKVEDVWEKDRRRIGFLKSQGYRVYVLWESDFKKNPSKCIRRFGQWVSSLS